MYAVAKQLRAGTDRIEGVGRVLARPQHHGDLLLSPSYMLQRSTLMGGGPRVRAAMPTQLPRDIGACLRSQMPGTIVPGTTNLLDDDVNTVAILHFEFVRRLGLANAVAIEEEADRVHAHALPLAERAHQLFEFGIRFALEEDCGRRRRRAQHLAVSPCAEQGSVLEE